MGFGPENQDMPELAPRGMAKALAAVPGPPTHREGVYLRTAYFFGDVDFFRGAPLWLSTEMGPLPNWS